MMEFTQPDRIPDEGAWPGTRAFRNERQNMNGSTATPKSTGLLPADQVLSIAQEDATRVYRDLSVYRVSLTLESDGWHVDYDVKDPAVMGGGPHYVIDAHRGAILAKRYEQ